MLVSTLPFKISLINKEQLSIVESSVTLYTNNIVEFEVSKVLFKGVLSFTVGGIVSATNSSAPISHAAP